MMLRALFTGTVLVLSSGFSACRSEPGASSQPSAEAAEPAAEAADSAAVPEEAVKKWDLFDGESLKGWKEIDFAGQGGVEVKEGELVFGMGEVMTGLVFDGDPPLRMNYEIALEAKRVMGSDFFCGLTFPVGEKSVSLIVGGWGGNLVGISSIDGMDASENQTSSVHRLEKDRWYRIKVRVTEGLLEAWLDDKQVVNFATAGHRLSLRFGEIEDCAPLGLATYQTKAAFRNLRLTAVE